MKNARTREHHPLSAAMALLAAFILLFATFSASAAPAGGLTPVNGASAGERTMQT